MKDQNINKTFKKLRVTLIIVIAICLIVIPVTAVKSVHKFSPEDQAAMIRNDTTTNYQFAMAVADWIFENTEYSIRPGAGINSTDTFWVSRVGDCSERALLFERMVSPYTSAQVVHGSMIGTNNLHDEVKIKNEIGSDVYYDGYTDKEFHEIGDGIFPHEFIIRYPPGD